MRVVLEAVKGWDWRLRKDEGGGGHLGLGMGVSGLWRSGCKDAKWKVEGWAAAPVC